MGLHYDDLDSVQLIKSKLIEIQSFERAWLYNAGGTPLSIHPTDDTTTTLDLPGNYPSPITTSKLELQHYAKSAECGVVFRKAIADGIAFYKQTLHQLLADVGIDVSGLTYKVNNTKKED